MNTTNCENYPIFLDCEASSLDKKSFPIEIAWNNADGIIESYLINIYRYPDGYDDWSREAQSLHGITKQYLGEKGHEPQFVVDRMEKKLKGKELLTDAPKFDGFWVRRLYESVNKECELQFGNAVGLFHDLEPFNYIYESQARKLSGHAHRAANDVEYLLIKYRLCAGWMMNVKIYIRDGISYIQNCDLTDEEQELFGLFNFAAACPYFPDEGRLSYSCDYERYLERKKSYVKKYNSINEFRAALKKHYGYIPYA